LLFESRDLSEIRTYVQRQFSKMMSGRANLSDFIFRKEVRLGTYAPGKPAPPAALVSTKEMAKDPRAEPQYGERVPYIVAAGHHQARLIDLVFHPDYFLKYPEKLRPNANYYITKQVIPSLSRVFNLIGVDITSWYTSMPKNVRLLQQLQLPGKGGPNAKSRIDQYYLSQHCPICDELTRRGLCDNCSKNKQSSAYILTVRMRHLQQQLHHLNEICVQCQGTRDPTVDCVSLDCAVLFERNKVNIAAATVQSYVQSLGQ
jgi:DNA polymerase zeta